MVVFDVDDFRSRVVTAARQAIIEVEREIPDSEVCGFALYSDSDATSLSPAFNCRTHLAKMQAEYPEDPFYFKWIPGEWSHESVGVEFFDDISKDMLRFSQSAPEGAEFKKYRDHIFSLCVDALKELRKTELAGVIFAFSVTDSIDPETQIHWIKEINSPLETAEFEGWIAQQ